MTLVSELDQPTSSRVGEGVSVSPTPQRHEEKRLTNPTHRRMRDAAFRQPQLDAMYAPHVAPVNRYVDELREMARGWVPYVAPLHGGIEGRALFLLRDPGPMTDPSRGSGFLCVENV